MVCDGLGLFLTNAVVEWLRMRKIMYLYCNYMVYCLSTIPHHGNYHDIK